MMKFIICTILLLSVAMAEHPINEDIVEEIKSSTNLWTPVEVEDNIFQFHAEEDIIGMLGTKIDDERDMRVAKEMGIFEQDEESIESASAEFDSREQWGDICSFTIKDQGACGSCWAFGAVESFENRVCIKSGGKFNEVLSEQHMVSCDFVGMGCSGGWPISAFEFLAITGVPTEACQPYTSGETKSAWGCKSKCTDRSLSNKKYRCKHVSASFTNKGIKAEVEKNGPVETTIHVYADFMNYKEGIYQHTTGKMLGGHAVKLVGWGVEEGVKYFIIANSWSTQWGEDGYFRIVEGDSGIGNSGYSCTPYNY